MSSKSLYRATGHEQPAEEEEGGRRVRLEHQAPHPARRALLCAPYFSSCVLAANTLLHSGDEDAKNAHLPGIASGEPRATLAFTEESGRWDEGGITMQATPGDGGWTLDGVKSYVLDGATANLILVAARSDAGHVDRRPRGRHRRADRVRDHARGGAHA